MHASRVCPQSQQQRFSIESLLGLASEPRVQVGRFLLSEVSNRLAAQERRLQSLADRLAKGGWPKDSESPHVIRTASYHTPIWKQTQHDEWQQALAKARKHVETIQWIHTDTHNKCQEILAIDPSYHAMPMYLKETLTQVQARHARTVETLAEMVVTLRQQQASSPSHAIDLSRDEFILQPFLQQRLGIQLLCEHYMEICKGKVHGTIDYQRPLESALWDAMGEAKILTEAYYPHPPDYQLGVKQSTSTQSFTPTNAIEATFVGPWLHYALVELLKNATTATVEEHQQQQQVAEEKDAPPPVNISYSHTNENDIAIVIEDHGPGISVANQAGSENNDSYMDSFAFAHTEKIWDRLDEQTTYAMVRSPLQGLGVGLALSSAMMRHFGGSLRLQRRKEHSNNKQGGTLAIIRIPLDLTILEPPLEDG